MDVTPRIAKLCERARAFEDDADPYLRGLVATEVYRDEPHLTVVRKRAEILARTLERIEPVILPEERIVGPAYRRFRVHGGVGEEDAWRIAVLFPDRRGFNPDWPMPDEVRRELSWWEGRDIHFAARNDARQRHSWMRRYCLAGPHGLVQGHTLPDHGILLEAGIAGMRRRIAERLDGDITEAQRDQLAAMGCCLEGLQQLCRNCAEAARRSLPAASADCAALAEHPPATLAQALQLLYFSNFADRMDTAGDASSFGRVDRLLESFYRADLEAGRLDRDGAFELICGFFLKQWDVQGSHNVTVGGVDPAGRDATGDVSRFFVRAMEATEMASDMTVRLHADSPPDFVRHVMRLVRLGLGRPSVYNDDAVVPALIRHGIEPEDARDYAPLGCVEVMIPGRSAFRTMCMGLNPVKVLELVLNRGRCLVTGDRVWDDVPDRFEDFDGLRAEYHRRIRQIVDAAVEIIREDERLEPRHFPRPWLSVLSRGGIEDAVDITAGQPKYDPVGVTLDGLADVVNSLYAIRRLVYKEEALTLDGLRGALEADWDGYEALRQRVVNRFPRFGQDDAQINRLAREEAAHYAGCFEGRRTSYGGPFLPMIFGVGTSLVRSKNPATGATPSGRRAGESLAMSLQPSPAGPRGAPTELFRCLASLDHADFPGGISNVQELDPGNFTDEDGLDRLTELVTTFFRLGGMEVSLNFVDEEKLRAAQADPDAYRQLTVRLFGLSAHFVDLSPDVQESIIERVAAAGRGR